MSYDWRVEKGGFRRCEICDDEISPMYKVIVIEGILASFEDLYICEDCLKEMYDAIK